MTKKVLLLGIGLLLFVTAWYFTFGRNSKVSDYLLSLTNSEIAYVGEEKIYWDDFYYETSNHPTGDQKETRTLLLEKLINDSIILQSGAKEGRIVLTPEIYGNNKNYPKRIEAIESVKKSVELDTDSISGTVLTIFFFNNGASGTLDYDGAKRLALTKITQIHDLVESKELTIEEAADRIRNDVTLQQVDVAYQTNASFDFNVKNDEKITIDNDFDTVVRSTKGGDITEVLPFKEPTTLLGKSIETAYAFAYVKERKTDGKVVTFNDWLTQQKSNYRVVYKYNP